MRTRRLRAVALTLGVLAAAIAAGGPAGASARHPPAHCHAPRCHAAHPRHARPRRHHHRPPAVPAPSGGGAPAPSATVPVPAPVDTQPPTPSGGDQTPPPSAIGPAHLQVSAREFTLTLSHPQIAAGAASIEFLNAGQDPHNLHLRGADGLDVAAFGVAAPATRNDQTFTLPAGTYVLYCSLPGLEQSGMHATLIVR